jgi:hypothetical protein
LSTFTWPPVGWSSGHPHAGGLAASRGADHGDELTVLDLELDILQRDKVLAVLVEHAIDMLELDDCH